MSLENLFENNECIICFDPIDNENKNINFFKECEHSNNYHIKCANNWIKECVDKNVKPTCPVCRNEIIIIDIETQYNEITPNYKSLKIYIFTTSILIITVFINHNYNLI
jgi:ATP sulfurylase